MRLGFQSLFLGSRGIRAGWKMLIFMMIFLFISAAIVLGSSLLLGRDVFNDRKWDSSGALLLHMLMIAGVFVSSFIVIRFLDGRPFATLGYWLDPGWVKDALLGTMTGFFIMSSVILIGAGSGIYHLSFSALEPAVLMQSCIKYAVLIFIYAVFEELLFRGYLLQTFIDGAGSIIAVSVLSLIFGTFHYMNPNGSLPGVINTGLAGALLSITYVKTRSLWFPSFLHFSWNFTLGYIFGFPVSGIKLSNVPVTVGFSGSSLSGGDFGPEASIITTFVLIGVLVLLIEIKALKPSERMVTRWQTYRAGDREDASCAVSSNPVQDSQSDIR